MRKKPAQPIPSAVERNVEAIKVAVIRLKNVATLIDLARIDVGKTSLGMSQAPGPIPTLKNDKYNANPITAKAILPASSLPKKVMLVRKSATAMPINDIKIIGRLPRRSKK
mmetsp:Transcript_2787/g.4079  ORF Transcript_2787/g.4079 Transcript_2787/m.4079 type:complete len:111 (-) Transcript_2787:564-896(-)